MDPLNWPDFQPSVDFALDQDRGRVRHGDVALAKAGHRDHQGHRARRRSGTVSDVVAPSWTREGLPRRLDGVRKSVVATGGGDVNAGDFCNKPTFDTLTQESIRLLGPYSNCYHDGRIDPRHRININVKGILPLEADFSELGPRRVA